MFQTLAESHFDEFVGVVPGGVCLRLSLRACLCLGPVVEGLDLEAANEGALNNNELPDIYRFFRISNRIRFPTSKYPVAHNFIQFVCKDFKKLIIFYFTS